MSGSILVLGDSLSYYGETGGLPADDARIWPNLVGAALGRRVELFARIGWTSRDVWWAITQDPRIWAEVPKADVLVLAFGGMDSLPSPMPTALREQIRYLRPNRLRQVVRDGYSWMQPRLSSLGWPMALPPRVSLEYFEKVRGALTHLRPDLPIVVCLPSTHDSPYYGRAHPGRVPLTVAIKRWADEHSIPTVSAFYDVTSAAYDDPESAMNPDGIHWGLAAHAQIAESVADVVRPLLPGQSE